MNAIEIEGVSRSYEDFSVRNISLTLPSGMIMGLVGENGAGKTTMINLIMNALHADSGKIRVLGCDNTLPEFTAVKQDISVVADTVMFPDNFSAAQVSKMLSYTYTNWNSTVFDGYLDRFELSRTKLIRDYSKGMAMKLSLAAALSHDSRLLLLDEPTGGLDPFFRDMVLDVLVEYTRSEDRSILISSHIVSDLEHLCDLIAFMRRGELVMCDTKDHILEEYAVIRTSSDMMLPISSVKAVRKGRYDTQVLMRREDIPRGITPERSTLEDIIVFMGRSEDKVIPTYMTEHGTASLW